MKTSWSFIVIGVIILLWNLIGLTFFVRQYTGLDKFDAYTTQIFAAMPAWAWIAYAIAVGAGTFGAILLLMKKAAAVPFFALSVIAVVIQFGYSFLATDLLAVKGWGSAGFPAFIFLVAVAQFLYVRALVANGTLR